MTKIQHHVAVKVPTLWCQLEDMFQLVVMPQGIEKVTIQSKDTPTKLYAIGAKLILSKVPLEVPSYIGKSTGSNKRSVPINRPVSSNRKQKVSSETNKPRYVVVKYLCYIQCR